jgi:hypothetical protein
LVLLRCLVVFAAILAAPVAAAAADCGGIQPCACGDTVTADRTLACGADPVTDGGCAGDGLTVDEDVALDLGGCRITGQGGGIGVTVLDRGSVTNGRIVNFGIGVFGHEVAGIARLRVDRSATTGIWAAGDESHVARNVVRDSGGIGIDAEAIQTIVSHNRVERSGACGVRAGGWRSVVSRNLVSASGDCGIRLGGEEVLADRNQVGPNAGHGIQVDHATSSTLLLNVSRRNGGDGFHVAADAAGNRFERNVAHDNDGFGVVDESTGDQTAGTANAYVRNRCTANDLGDSSPAGLCQ